MYSELFSKKSSLYTECILTDWDIMDKQSDIYSSSVELTSVQSVLCKLAVL